MDAELRAVADFYMVVIFFFFFPLAPRMHMPNEMKWNQWTRVLYRALPFAVESFVL